MIKPIAASLCATGTLATIIGCCGLFVMNAPTIKNDTDKYETVKSISEVLGYGGSAVFMITFPIMMAPTRTKTIN